MKPKKFIYEIFIFTVFSFLFIFLFFNYLILKYKNIIPQEEYQIPFLSLTGFAVIIIIFFIVFTKLNYIDNLKHIRMIFFNENCLKLMLIILLIITFLIPPVTFSDALIDWNQIHFLNYIRAIVFLIGSGFLPGACLIGRIMQKENILKEFKIDPILLKLTFYPLFSFSFLGIISMILEFLGILREFFVYILFSIIIVLFLIDYLIQYLKNEKYYELKLVNVKISIITIFILVLAISIILISSEITFTSNYLLESDAYGSINYAFLIGRSDTKAYDKLYTYAAFWGYISFSLSSLCGIPAVNVNVLLFIFLYLFPTSLYIFIKACLFELEEKYSILATIISIISSCLFLLKDTNLGRFNTSPLAFWGIIYFTYRSFSFFLLFASMGIFIIVIKNFNFESNKYFVNKNALILLSLSVFFLLISSMIYLIPLISAVLLIFLFTIFSTQKYKDYKVVSNFWLLFCLLFIIIDILASFYFSWNIIWWVFNFLGKHPPFESETLFYRLFLNALIFYFCIILLLAYFVTLTFYYKKNPKTKYKSTVNSLRIKLTYIVFMIIFSVFLFIELFYNNLEMDINVNRSDLNEYIEEVDFFYFFLNLIITRIGIFGILSVYLSYFSYKKNPQIFKIIGMWIIFILILASSLIIITWIKYPTVMIPDIVNYEFVLMMYWFERTWFYSIIPISIISSIGIIEFRNSLRNLKRNIKIKKILRISQLSFNSNLIIASFLITISFSRIICNSLYWYNVQWYVEDEEAQMLGYISENIPKDSNILVDRRVFERYLYSLTFCNFYWIWDEEAKAHDSDDSDLIFKMYVDEDCVIDLINEKYNEIDLLEFKDNNEVGSAKTNLYFSSTDYGYINFSLTTTNNLKVFWISLYSQNSIPGITLITTNKGLYYYNGSDYQKIISIKNEEIYRFQLFFETSSGSYMDLERYTWNISINELNYGPFIFRNNISKVAFLSLETSYSDKNWKVYVFDLSISWMIQFDIRNLFYSDLYKFINYLNSKDIQYFILSHKYENEREDLVEQFYKNKLYNYKSLTLYKS